MRFNLKTDYPNYSLTFANLFKLYDIQRIRDY